MQKLLTITFDVPKEWRSSSIVKDIFANTQSIIMAPRIFYS